MLLLLFANQSGLRSGEQEPALLNILSVLLTPETTTHPFIDTAGDSGAWKKREKSRRKLLDDEQKRLDDALAFQAAVLRGEIDVPTELISMDKDFTFSDDQRALIQDLFTKYRTERRQREEKEFLMLIMELV